MLFGTYPNLHFANFTRRKMSDWCYSAFTIGIKHQTNRRGQHMYKSLTIVSLFTLPPLAIGAEPVTPMDSPIIVYASAESFEDIKSNIEIAITGRGMLITNTLHISEMLDRTAADTGLETRLYENAESLEFCSIQLSYRMSEAHPANMATCPLTLSIYQKAGDAEHTYIAYRRPALLGDATAVERDLTRLIDGIVHEALE